MDQSPGTENAYQLAKLLYTQHDLTEEDIAARTGIPVDQVHYWVTEYDWAGVRRSLVTSRHIQLGILYDILSAHTQYMKGQETANTTKDADLLIKYTAAISNLERDTSVSEVIDVATLFTTWLLKRDLDLCKTVTRQFDVFIKERLKAN